MSEFQQLIKIRESVIEQYGLNRLAIYATRRVSEELECETITGAYVDLDGVGHAHEWNIWKGRVIDLDAKRFNPEAPEVLILDLDSEDARNHYLPGVYVTA